MSVADDYRTFIASKSQLANAGGFVPLWVPDFLFGFQKSLAGWSVRQGRAAVFADCGLGKTAIQLVWAENVVRQTNRPVLVLTPLAVGRQTVAEADKFGVEAVQSRDGKVPASARVVVTNYEKLHLFDATAFAGVVCDESSILKNFDGVRRHDITEFMRQVPYRLLCTATAAPNDYVELGTSAEALGEMGYQDMITRFFKQETSKDDLGWGRTKYRMRGHAERDFWRWVVSWSRAVRKPSDLGFDDGAFVLPPLTETEHVVPSAYLYPGELFPRTARDLPEQRAEAKRTLPGRCDRAAELVADTGEPAVVWCHLNPEGDRITKAVPGAVQVSGSDSDEQKEETFAAFAAGQIRVLVTKPSIAGFGLNWQHCAHQTYFPSHSFEQFFQCVRRCWRFGQKRPVRVDVIASEGEAGVLANLKRKAAAADAMFATLVDLMNNELRIVRGDNSNTKQRVPSWM